MLVALIIPLMSIVCEGSEEQSNSDIFLIALHDTFFHVPCLLEIVLNSH